MQRRASVRLSVSTPVCLSVCLSRHSPAVRRCCWFVNGQEISIDCCLALSSRRAAARRPAANAGSATLLADVGT